MTIDLTLIPHNPGCYLYKDSNQNIIYIGKAKDLKKRVSSYFQKKDHDAKTAALVQNIKDVEFIATNTEVEAFLLESNLIKKYKPKYNIDLKDSKRYAYLKLTNEAFPRLLTARQKDKTGTYFGPFTSGAERDAIKEAIIKSYQLRTCKTFPKKPCLRYHINLCEAPCVNYISKEEYQAKIPKIKEALKGKTKELIESLEKELHHASKQLQFERAKEIKKQIDAMTYLEEKQTVERQRQYNEDIFTAIKDEEQLFIMFFSVNKGVLSKKNDFVIDYTQEALEEFLIQYYDSNPIPKEIITDIEISKSLHEYLETKKEAKVTITNPKIGEKKTLLELVKKNIELTFFAQESQLKELQDILNLENPPKVIECFDISHLQGTNVVASMVQFENGIPNKKNYRRFKIKSFLGNNDFLAMQEVVKRRYARIIRERTRFPDLIMVDGGKGQLSSAIKALDDLNLRLPIISLAKREEEVFIPGESESLIISKKNKGLHLLQQIRDEAHRFAITYNKLLRTKKAFE